MATKKTNKVKASVKANTVQKTKSNVPQTQGTKLQQLNSLLSLMVLPCKNGLITGQTSFMLAGKSTSFTIGTKHNINVSATIAGAQVLQVLLTLYNKYILPQGAQWGIKAVNALSLGICNASNTSYKCIIAHHRGNGQNALCINQCKLFTMQQAQTLAGTHNLLLLTSSKKTWGIINVTASNIQAVVNYIVALLNLKPVKA